LGLQRRTIKPTLAKNEIRALLHENVHIRLQLTRERLRTRRFDNYYYPQGALKSELQLYFGNYTAHFSPEEIFAYTVNAAAGLDDLCTKPYDPETALYLDLDLQRLHQATVGFTQILAPVVREYSGESLRTEPGTGEEEGWLLIHWPGNQLNIGVFAETPALDENSLIHNIQTNVTDEENIFAMLQSVLSPYLKDKINSKGVVSLQTPSKGEVEKLCPLRDELWGFIGQVDHSLLELRSK
jgi:hypothetical protein